MESSTPVHDSEDYLVQQAIKRDRAAFTALYENCVDRVYRHVYYRVSNHDEAEDITQEAFVRAWKVIDKYKKTGAPFVSWIITIAGNLVIDYYRRQQKVEITDEIEKIEGTLRFLFTFGVLEKFGTPDQVIDSLIQLSSETPLDRLFRHTGIGKLLAISQGDIEGIVELFTPEMI